MGRRWDIYLIPGSHFDYGWAASPGECFAYLTEIVRSALEDMRERPEIRFTAEYAIFVRHFLDTYPEYLPLVKQYLDEGRLDLGCIMSGAIEQWLDGEMLVHQLVRAKRWIADTLGYEAVTAQHSDLPGHVLQIAQFLHETDIRHLAYSRYRPPSPLHIWRSPDGSQVLACSHYHEPYDVPWDWSGYGWGKTLFGENADKDVADRELRAALERREAIWPEGVSSLLMGCQGDLVPLDPALVDRVADWNANHLEAPIHIATTRQFFESLDPARLPVYQGEAPYAFFALPSVYIPCAQAMRAGENAIAAAEKWSSFAEWSDLGRAPHTRLLAARDALFLPHDHNTAGRRGEVNDPEREKDAVHAKLEGESVLQEKAMAFTVNIAYRPMHEGTYPIVVFNALSWDRDDVVETYLEIPLTKVRAIRLEDSRGRAIPVQILRYEEHGNGSRVYLLFIARGVPAHGYETYYATPLRSHEPVESHLFASASEISNGAMLLRMDGPRVASVTWNGRAVSGEGPRPFNAIYMLEDRHSNVEAPPWKVDSSYTGKTWDATMTRAEFIEQGPVRAILRCHGRILGSRFAQDLIMYDGVARLDLRHTVHYRMRMHTMMRAAYPLAVPDATATYESPYGAVRLDADEMPNTFRGHGERWVQKWADLSNGSFGVTFATRQVSHAITSDGIEPILIRTAEDCGTPFHHYDQNRTFVFDHALFPHAGDWKSAASHRAGWAFNNPLYACNWTPCYPIQPLRRSRNLPERGSFLQVDMPNVVVTAVAPSMDNAGAWIVRAVEYHGVGGRATLSFKRAIGDARLVNFLERDKGAAAHSGSDVYFEVRPYGIHTLKIRFAP
ncbi:MAG: glycosyl hydrolase-related protein [Candidatus Hydrogenedentes bacterium]|nr:glycosyl hydrolase-related protein [Candidatus Hydrogenedentota bacterium]